MDTHDVTRVPQYMQLLVNRKKTLQAAQARTGQRIVNRRSRDDLTTQFRFRLLLSRGQSRAGSHINIRTAFIPPAYGPCVHFVYDLQKVMINELLLEIHQREKYIMVRTITPQDRITAVMATAENDQGTILITKEPYLKLMSDGDYGLRIDHPSDLVYIPNDDKRIPSCCQPRVRELGVSGEQLRMQGNKFFIDCNYRAAIELYSSALILASNEGEAQVLRLNRSLALLKAKKFDAALTDLEPMVSVSKPVEKALYRKAQALYNLQNFGGCCEVLTTLRLEYPDNSQAKKELLRATKRFQEQTSATYKFKQLHIEADKLRPPHLDHATYTASVEIRGVGIQGRGLLTNRALKAGELLLCEKAFAHAYTAGGAQQAGDRDNDLTLLVNVERDSITIGAQSELIQMILQKIPKSPSFAPTIMDLHHGSYDSVGFRMVDSTPVIDTFYIERVIALNACGCPLSSRLTHTRDMAKDAVREANDKQFHSCSIWPVASYVNHSCNSNARRAFIGDIMIVRATRDLAPDEEIDFWYQVLLAEENDDRQKKLKHWGFRCDCTMCQADQTTNRKILNSRRQQRAEVLRHFKMGRKANLPKIKMPRLHIWDLYLRLGQIYMHRQDPTKAVNSALQSLSSLGYVIEGGNLPRTPECWGLLCGAYHLVAPDLAAQSVKYAKLSYRICVGEDETFEETYKNLT
ncbi:related to TPR domain protein [Rhynchosporium agropyri]|uniref:Related to TPR domain protein n=1 Tax=Rhynchosporium agropyri TaxID=914238 RepID=A0A1E1L912_9HELO|nr:related to TPR domain protein [Rhynchosporium agropyri]